MKNILITSAGRRVSLVRYFKIELKAIFSDAKVFTTDANPEYSSACRISDGYFKVVRVTKSNYIEELLKLVLANNIKIIIPTIDTELLILSQNIDLFKKYGVEIVISDYENVKVFRDKRLTHQFFEKQGINCAKEFDKQNYQLPLYIKPTDGSRSVDNYVIKIDSDLIEYHFSNDKLMFLEYLDHSKHTEFTIDLYYDKNCNLKCFIPRERLEVRDGEVNKAITRDAVFIPEIWKKMKHIKGFRGCITLQIFVNNDTAEIYGIEINPRFGGGFPLSYLAGGNFPKWIIEEYILDSEKIEVCDEWEKNLLMLRYDDEVLIRDFNG
nr:ATP-grasp domain-containing protein [uncultured Flavobacterium sp.]